MIGKAVPQNLIPLQVDLKINQSGAALETPPSSPPSLSSRQAAAVALKSQMQIPDRIASGTDRPLKPLRLKNIKINFNTQSAADKRVIDILKLEELTKTNRSSVGLFFHGSRSASLIIFSEFGKKFDHALMSMGNMMNINVFPHCGERGNALSEKALNKTYISVVDMKNVVAAYDWATNSSAASPTSDSGNPLSTFKEKKNIEKLKKGCKSQLSNLSPTEQKLVEADYPVLYAVKPDLEKRDGSSLPKFRIKKVQSDVSGEYGINGSLTPSEMEFLFVPDDRVGEVEALLNANPDCADITVKGFSSFTV